MNGGKSGAGWRGLALAAALSTGAGAAIATDMKIHSPIVERGVTEMELQAFRDFDKRPAFDKNQEYKLSVGHGFTDWLALEVGGEFEKEKSEGKVELEAHELEALFQFTPQGKYWMDVGLLAEYEHAAEGGHPDQFTLAPLFEKEFGQFTATVNLAFARESGPNKAPGTQFSYGARVKYHLESGLQPAIELFGDPGRIGHTPSYSQQPHWIGPALYGKWKTAPGQALVWSVAALFGTTDAASDTRAVVRLEYEF
jgi:hypothetical protein